MVDTYGHDHRALDYAGREAQIARFRVLSGVSDLRNRRVLDVGCGFADYASYLQERFHGVDYKGVDITPRMIEEARRLRPHLDLSVCNILEEMPEGNFDVVTANGIFYLLGERAPVTMQSLIQRMFEIAGSAVAFSSLSSWAPAREEGEFYADPIEVIRYCRTLTPWVVLRHDYHVRDFTIYLYKTIPEQGWTP